MNVPNVRYPAYRYLSGVLAAVLGIEKVVHVEVPTPTMAEPDTPEEARYYARMYDNMADLLEHAEERGVAMAEEAQQFLRELE